MKTYVLVGSLNSDEERDSAVLGVFDHKPTTGDLQQIKQKITRVDVNNKPFLLWDRISLETWELNSVAVEWQGYEILSWSRI